MRSPTEADETSANGNQWLRVVGDRVECGRVGWTDLGRCRECAYLVRLDIGLTDARPARVLCLILDLPPEPAFAW